MGLFLLLDVWLIYQQILASKWQPALKRAELGSPALPAVRAWKGSYGGNVFHLPLEAGRTFGLALPTMYCGLVSKRSLSPWMSFRPQYSPWHPPPPWNKAWCKVWVLLRPAWERIHLIMAERPPYVFSGFFFFKAKIWFAFCLLLSHLFPQRWLTPRTLLTKWSWENKNKNS